ncbi:chlorohydrolase/deaminase family protein [Streptococcus pneumoniae]|nr:chlorohydrolase/deaminase family protein [Streptococcus pneumoniae]
MLTQPKNGFEVADRTDEVSNHTYGRRALTWFEEIFEEYETKRRLVIVPASF